jgi:arginyl-tRNA synthetase
VEPIPSLIAVRLRQALADVTGEAVAAVVTAASDARFGDYQSNAAMVLAKQRRTNPRQLAADIVARLDVHDLCQPPTVEGAGFINFRLRREFLEQRTTDLLRDPRLGVPAAEPARRIVIDFSAPNVAKPMHVGHIRSTILGDALTRIARFLGHQVVADNHLGDWGTQFGMVIYGWKNLLDRAALEKDPVAELVRLYKETNARCQADDAVRDTCRGELVRLQQGDPENREIWRRCVDLSWQEFTKAYTLLDVRFDEHLGESFYHDRLGPLVDDLLARGIAEISDGAACVFFREHPELADKPCLVRKRDGGFNYATTDLATIAYRVERWQPDAIWYVVGAPQRLHLLQVFAVSRLLGATVELQHISFGSILGEDRKIMKTRSGDNVPLLDVLTEAQQRARRLIEEKNPELPEAEKAEIARVIGLGSVKYAELSQFRMTDYVFAWNKMLSFQGNTAPYLQNAYVRIRSIFRKGGAGDEAAPAPAMLALAEPAEQALALKLNRYGEVVPEVLDDFRPNLLANYLYELATTFHGFYETCPVLKAEGPTRASRLALCQLAARTLQHGLALLGIEVPERM